MSGDVVSGLERIAEELMGRRKWKLYQESMSISPLHQTNHMLNHHLINNNHTTVKKEESLLEEKEKNNIIKDTVIKQEQTTAEELQGAEGKAIVTVKENGSQKDVQEDVLDEQERLKDWSPQNKCYFCVDGKLDSDHNNHGAPVSKTPQTPL